MNACADIQATVSTYLDGELEDTDLREFETHLSDCESCQGLLEQADRAHSALRAHLRATPPAPDLMQRRLMANLDKEDVRRRRENRRQWLSWSLPVVASAAAAAALALFIWTDLSGPPAQTLAKSSRVTEDAARQHLREVPLFASGDRVTVAQSAASFLEKPVQPPRFSSPEVKLLGWTPAQLGGKQSATFVYEVNHQTGRHRVHAHAVDLRGVDMKANSQRSFSFDSGTLWIDSAYGFNTVTFAPNSSVGYVFSSDMSVEELVGLVIKTDIVNALSRAPIGR